MSDGDRPGRPHDRLIRLMLGDDPEAAAGELRVLLPPSIAEAIDWSTFAHADPALLGPDLSERTADFLFRVKLAGSDALLYVLLEHQSAAHPLFVVRAFIYLARVLDRWMRQNPDATRVPPVVPALLTHVDGGWRVATSLRDVFDLGDGPYRAALEQLLPELRLTLIDDLATVDDDALEARSMPVRSKLMLAAMRDIRPATDLAATLQRLDARWLRRLSESDPRDRAAIEAFFSYIPAARPRDDIALITQAVRAIRPSAEEDLVTTIQQLMDQSEAKGKADGKAEGKADGKRDLLARLLVRKFGSIAPALQARLDGADEATLELWSERIFEVSSPDELLSS